MDSLIIFLDAILIYLIVGILMTLWVIDVSEAINQNKLDTAKTELVLLVIGWPAIAMVILLEGI